MYPSCLKASSNVGPSTLFSVIKITGNLPIYSEQNSLSSKIFVSLNNLS
jgi:hypothetical protein